MIMVGPAAHPGAQTLHVEDSAAASGQFSLPVFACQGVVAGKGCEAGARKARSVLSAPRHAFLPLCPDAARTSLKHLHWRRRTLINIAEGVRTISPSSADKLLTPCHLSSYPALSPTETISGQHFCMKLLRQRSNGVCLCVLSASLSFLFLPPPPLLLLF